MEESFGSLMGKLQKNLFVCFDRECKRRDSMSCCCPSPEEFVPDDCEYAIFHSLETTQIGRMAVGQKGRQTGKTTTLARVASYLAKKGQCVYYVTRTLDMGKHIKRTIDSRVRMLSLGQMKTGSMRGYRAGYIVADEIYPHELEEVERELAGSSVIAAHWT